MEEGPSIIISTRPLSLPECRGACETKSHILLRFATWRRRWPAGQARIRSLTTVCTAGSAGNRTMNLGEACLHVLGRSAFCVSVSFSPSLQVLGGIAALVGVLCYYRFRRRKVGYGDISSWVTNELVNTHGIGRKYRRQ